MMPYQSVATSERLSISSTTSDPDPTASTSSSRENLLMSDGKPPPAGLFVTDLGSPYENPGRYESGYLDGTHNFKGLRRVADRIPVAAWFIIITEFCERFAYYGGSAPFQNYVQFPPGDHNQAGALGKGQSTATALQNVFTFFAFLTPVFGAIIADQHLGRYRTILIFSIIYMAGWLILTATATPMALVAGAGFPGFVVALVVIGTGTGGIKSIVSPMCADQFKQTEPKLQTLNTGERVIVDPDLNVQRLYNWFYWSINIGALLGGIACPKLELDVGFWAAFLLPTCMFAAAIVIFVAGNRFYVKNCPTESALLKAYRVFAFACRRAARPENRHTRKQAGHSVLDFAKVQTEMPEVALLTRHEMMQIEWNDEFVDELKHAIMACKIFIPMAVYWICYSQLSNNLLSQAAQLARPNGVPNDIMNNFDPIALVIFIPIMDSVVYPTLRKWKINFPPMARITLGFLLVSTAMTWSAFLQYTIYRDPAYQDTGASLRLVWLQVPTYILIAFSEIFASITALEYSYTHAPRSMKSLVSALALIPNAGAALIGLAVAPVARDPNMHIMYAVLAGASAVGGVGFWIAFKDFDRLDTEYRFTRLEKRRAEREREEREEAEQFELEEYAERATITVAEAEEKVLH